MVISVDLEGMSGAPTPDSINAWISSHGLTHPVVNDGGQSQMSYIVSGFPTYVIIDRQMVIANADLWPFDPNYVIGML